MLELRSFCFPGFLVFDCSDTISDDNGKRKRDNASQRTELTVVVDHIFNIPEDLSISLLGHACLLLYRSTIRFVYSRGL